MFAWYELRTTDLDAAADFYAAVAGWHATPGPGPRIFLRDGRPAAGLVELPERARASGAPPHWLGHARVTDLDAALRRLVELGGQVLAPPRPAADGGMLATVRDAQGAVFALATGQAVSAPGAVTWHDLHTTDREQAFAAYAALLGWTATAAIDLPPPVGRYQMFTWPGAAGSVGAMSDAARDPRIHTHWLFHLTVPDLDAALAAVRRLGGTVAHEPVRVAGGDRVAPCEDAQGAAVALRQRA
jgi:hypothetical protein